MPGSAFGARPDAGAAGGPEHALCAAPVPVLTYHQIDVPPARGTPFRSLTVHPKVFGRHMRWLARLGYRGLSMRELMPYLAGARSGKVFGLTFDDGFLNVHRHALPVLRERASALAIPLYSENDGWLAEEKGAPLWISQGDYLTSRMIYEDVEPFSVARMVDLFRQHGLVESAATAFVQRGNAYKTGIWPHPLKYRQLFAGDRLKIGEHTWCTIVGYGHAAEHMSLYCDELRVLISGDMLLPRISTNIAVQAVNPDGDPLRLFLASIDAFLALPADTLVLPAHGRPFRGIHDRVAQLHAHHVERCNVLLKACKGKAASAAELIPALFEREFDDIHQTMFAMGEAIAHLNHLWHAGRLRRLETGDVIRFIG